MKQHKHADLIKAWADGAKIQYLSAIDGKWSDCADGILLWDEHARYRIKPFSKEVTLYLYEYDDGFATYDSDVYMTYSDYKQAYKKTITLTEEDKI